MRRALFACALAVVVMLSAMPVAFADLDTGMEGLWTGTSPTGRLTLLLGSGGTFISIHQAGETYRQAGVFTTDIDNMYLTMTDGSTATLQYGFAEGYLYLTDEDGEAALQRADFPTDDDFTGVWVIPGAGEGDDGLIAMDAAGGFASVDVGSGEAEKGIYLPDQGDLLIAFQDCTSALMGYRLDTALGELTFINRDTGETITLTRYAQPATE